MKNQSVMDEQTPVEQSDHGLYCLPFCLQLLDTLLYGQSILVKF